MPETPSPLDTLVIGAGPVGLMLACELSRYGLRVRIVDAAPAPSPQSRALVVWPRTLEHLDRMGIAPAFAANGIHATEGHFYQGEDLLAELPLNAIETPFPYALMIPQDATERLLTEHLRSLGVEVERGVSFQSLEEGGDHVTATLTYDDGKAETVTARWLVGADGAHSAVRHAIGAQFAGDTLVSDWVLADFHQHDGRRVETVELHLHADGVLAMFPIPPDRVRVIANTASGKQSAQSSGEHAAPPSVEEIQRLLDTRGGKGITVKDPVWLSGFHINERKVADYRRGSVFLAGDAAHIHSPAGGQGMNTGMQDAVNLAWKLALVHSGELSVAGKETLLASYTAERSPVAEQVLKGSGFLTRMGTLDNALLRTLRDKTIHFISSFEGIQRAFAQQVSELAVAYTKTPLNGAQGKPGGPKPGERAPLTAGSRPVSAGQRPVFTLFAKAGADAETLIACYPDLLDSTPRAPFVEGGIWLVRPDGYVGYVGDSDGWAAADGYLAKLKWAQQA